MNLDKLQINASLRSGWQAIDLGFLIARAWWWPLFVSAAVPALVLFIPLLFVFSDQPLWALIIVWWLKPFLERLPLYSASRRMFADQPGHRETLSKLVEVYRKDFFQWLLWRRFSIHRSFDLPVTVLEGLQGNKRRERLRVLHGKYSDVSLGNQFICACFEIVVSLGLVILLSFFIPDNFGVDVMESLDDWSLLGQWIYSLAAFCAICLVIPFHSMAGFALYLNRRIELEAWDIEISFRNLSRSRKKASPILPVSALLVGLLSAFLLVAPLPADAALSHDRESAQQLIEQVLQGEDFGQEKTVQKWRFKNWAEDNQDKIPEWMIEFADWLDQNFNAEGFADGINNSAIWLKVILIAGFILLLIYLYRHGRQPLLILFGKLTPKKKIESAPEMLFGLDVTPESLPDDVPAQVLALWRQEKHREALGLLYRASLSRLIDRYEMPFHASHTEAECDALVSTRGISSLSEYFSSLTRVWRRLAYGHLVPEEATVAELCRCWQKELSDETI